MVGWGFRMTVMMWLLWCGAEKGGHRGEREVVYYLLFLQVSLCVTTPGQEPCRNHFQAANLALAFPGPNMDPAHAAPEAAADEFDVPVLDVVANITVTVLLLFSCQMAASTLFSWAVCW